MNSRSPLLTLCRKRSAALPITCLIAWLAAFASALAQDDPAWESTIDVERTSLYSPRQSIGFNELRWVKFTIMDPGGSNTLYFQDSERYPFHYDFAVEHIAQFSGLSAAEYDQQTLYNASRVALLGAVLVRLDFNLEPDAYAIELVSQDVLPIATVIDSYNVVRRAITAPAEMPHFYFPTYEQIEHADANQGELATAGIEVGNIGQWSGADVVYAPGWAIGRLRRFTADTVDAAYAQGELLPGDILQIDRVPAELPHVAGIIAEAPATPNSHVAILAKSWNIPFVHMPPASLEPFATDMQVVLRADDTYVNGFSDVRELDPDMDPDLLAEILSLKATPTLNIPAIEEAGVLWRDTDDLTPDDIVTVGGKAAHFGLLRDALPDQSPEAIAFTFDLWERFLDQSLPLRGQTLREEIAARLAPFNSWPTDAGALQTALAGIREIIKQEANFSAADQAAILDALAPFDPERKIRFRSSTNMEDSESFTGAGLYDSYSGCLLDDLDAENIGPSRCDPNEAEERGVFRALRKVYASFYNNNAFAERLRHRVDESTVGMAVLVHHSFPDEIELANGVATLTSSVSEDNWVSFRVSIVSQKGAVSVTNPDGNATPEVIEARGNASWVSSFRITQRSSLLRLGEPSVLAHPDEYEELLTMMQAVQTEWAKARPERPHAGLEFEFKKVAPDGALVIKQVRPLPDLPAPQERMYVLAGARRLEVPQAENNNVISIHRNKSIMEVQVPSQRLPALGAHPVSMMAHVALSQNTDGTIVEYDSDPSTWTGAQHVVEEDFYDSRLRFRSSWNTQVAGLNVRRSILLRYPAPRAAFPIHTLDAFECFLETAYPQQPSPWDLFPGGVSPEPDPADPASELLPVYSMNTTDAPVWNAQLQELRYSQYGVTIDTSFFFPPPPTGIVAGYTAPLHAWKETTITGLTQEPITLTGWFAQTYRPDHHNFSGSFIFEPRLDASVPASTLAELEAMDVHWILITSNFEYPGIHYIGSERSMRRLAEPDPLLPWFGEMTYPRDDWRLSEWFGYFIGEDFPEIYHAQHKWVHVTGTGPDNLWIWHYANDLGWTWTSQSIYPWLYSFNDADWLLYLENTTSPQWYFHYGDSTWRAHP